MKKNEVKVGGVYEAKVSNRIVNVRIDSTHSSQGWNATNTATGKRVHVKSAQRLRGPAKVAAESTAGEQPKSDAEERTAAPAPNPVPSNRKAPKGAASPMANAAAVKKPAKEPKAKRISAIDAAASVLANVSEPMTAQQLITAMAEQKLWTSPGGKTPHATLYAAIHREIFKKGTEARFQKVDRGLFVFNTKAGA